MKFIPPAVFVDRAQGNMVALQIRLHRPRRQRSHAAVTDDELQDGDGQLRFAARGLDVGGGQHTANQIEPGTAPDKY